MKNSENNYDNKNNYYRRWYNLVKGVINIYALTKPDYYPRGGRLPSGGNLILANHVTRFDQFIVGIYYYDSHIRYVSGENVFRMPLFRWFAEKCLNIIIHMRGVSSFETVRKMSKGLLSGENILIFPSGAMTFDGRSQKIDPSIAKLAKMSSCNLVLLKTNGGYFIQPRWGITMRKGKIQLTEYVISADELKKMSAAEVNAAINEHLYTDACMEQEKNPVPYIGKQLCKGLECCIYECPKCKTISGLTTSDTELTCKCGYTARYDEYGYLNNADGSKYTVTELYDAQRNHLKERFLSAKSNHLHEHLFGDDFELYTLHHSGKRIKSGNIRVDVYSDAVEYRLENDNTKKIINYSDIDSLFVYMRNTLDVHIPGSEHGFELRGDFSSNTLKYRDLFEFTKLTD